MNAQLAPEDSDTEPTPEGARALLRSVVITDLCDSTALVDRLGDVRATELIRAHDRLLRGLIREHRGQEIDKTDGFLSLFERPIQAVAFALAYQRGLRAFSLEHGVEVSARIGLHVGEVMTWQNEDADVAKGAKPTEVEGLAKPVAARLMGMALPGQILLSGVAYTLAHRAEGELGAALSRLQWKAHGDFRFKGVAEAVPVYEIGEQGIAPFKAPAWSGKAHREVPLWRRPAMLAFEVIALVVAVALPAWYFLKPEPAIAFAERDWVVLADLRNLTGDPRFDDSLEQAFRIGLEQSRHVNVLSDLKIDRTLELMRLDPLSTRIDRSVGSDVALREGARLLLIPTLAEVGGRLRLTAELIDPSSQTTLFVSHADSRSESALIDSTDQLVARVRDALGEADRAGAEQPGTPGSLARVTTSSMEALRAYSLGMRHLSHGRPIEADALFARALDLDDGFALAHLGRGHAARNQGDRALAIQYVERALSLGDKVPMRERLISEANLHMLRGEGMRALSAWRSAVELYPDSFPALGGLAWTLWMFGLDAPAAFDAAMAAGAEQNPNRATSLYLAGILALAMERIEQSRELFAAAYELGLVNQGGFHAASYAVERDYESFERVIAQGEGSGVRSQDWHRALFRLAATLDQGNWQALDRNAESLSALAADADPLIERTTDAVIMTLGTVRLPSAQFADSVSAFVDRELAYTPPDEDPEARVDQVRRLMLAARLAADSNQTDLTRRVLDAAFDRMTFDESTELRLYADSILESLGGAAEPRTTGATTLASGSIAAHWTLKPFALPSAKEPECSADAAPQPAVRRGLAYAELRGAGTLMAFNLVRANLSALEHALCADSADGARQRLRAAGLPEGWWRTGIPAGVSERFPTLLELDASQEGLQSPIQ